MAPTTLTTQTRESSSRVTLSCALLGLVAGVALAGCEGWMSAELDAERADTAVSAPNTPTDDGGTPDARETGEEPDDEDPDDEAPEVGEIDPNTLDQERLFHCEDPSPAASPARIRRLTPGQYYTRFVPPQGGIPYSSDERFQYSTNTDDATMDVASAEQMLQYGLMLGQNNATRRAGWGHCMQQSSYQPERDRPTRECMEQWGAMYLAFAWQREPTDEEIDRLVDYAWERIDRYGDQKGLALAAARPFLASNFLFKEEIGQGEPDADGRRPLGSWEVARAVAGAVTDVSLVGHYYLVEDHLFDSIDTLRAAAENDELQTTEQVEHHVRALLNVEMPMEDDPAYPVLPSNIRRFFREYLGYPAARYTFKSGGDLPQGESIYIYYIPDRLPPSVDRTLGFLYREDKQFLDRLLTTRDYYIVQTFNEANWPYNLADGTRSTPAVEYLGMTSLPADERAGVLTHPAWLVAHSRNQHTEPHPVHRGKWIYENMLCNAMPQLPITVDAQLPEMPSAGVTERLRSATGPDAENGYCWTCHKRMDPLGIPFETYSHFGRYRTEEKTADGSMVPVDAASTRVATGDPDLDGQQVADAVELAELLATSERVEGCFVRNVFRYFMGRNETYADACTLNRMRQAYRDNDGSFREMLVALMTSDTFLYRTPIDSEPSEEVQP